MVLTNLYFISVQDKASNREQISQDQKLLHAFAKTFNTVIMLNAAINCAIKAIAHDNQ